MLSTQQALYLGGVFLLNVVGIVILIVGLKPSVPDFTRYEAGTDRKEAFFQYFLPVIEKRNGEILQLRRQLIEWNEHKENLAWWNNWKLESLARKYEIEDFDPTSEEDWNTLLRRVDIVPPSLALAQSANESAWGTSRFAREGNNYYGEWCYVQGCGLVPLQRDEDEYHEVASFESPEVSVENYIHNLNYHSAYKTLRELREGLRAENVSITGMALADGLGNYSERGKEYIQELRSMIVFNDLGQYDEDYQDDEQDKPNRDRVEQE